MNKIATNLWYDKEAVEDAEFYVNTFEDTKILNKFTLHNTPSNNDGDVELVELKLMDAEFSMISAGPIFKFTPTVSFLIACDSPSAVNELYAKLAVDGTPLMEIGEYPFSQRYGWIQDKYGVSWQIMDMGERGVKQKVTPTIMYVGDVAGKAEEAVHFYAEIFKNSSVEEPMRYGKGEEPDEEGTIKHVEFVLEGQRFAAMDSAHEHKFKFNEAISFVINCDTQEENDYYWDKLSSSKDDEQCGWMKDKFGLSWQINPTFLSKMLQDPDRKKVDNVTQALLKMKKLVFKDLIDAFES